jgi:hypothetical protein
VYFGLHLVSGGFAAVERKKLEVKHLWPKKIGNGCAPESLRKADAATIWSSSISESSQYLCCGEVGIL